MPMEKNKRFYETDGKQTIIVDVVDITVHTTTITTIIIVIIIGAIVTVTMKVIITVAEEQGQETLDLVQDLGPTLHLGPVEDHLQDQILAHLVVLNLVQGHILDHQLK